MFLKNQDNSQKDYYQRVLKIVGSLSRLFSENDKPYIDSRIIENLFCKSFSAKNLARHDSSFDASKDGFGIGIKTFLNKNGNSFEKIAEFNKALKEYGNLDTNNKIIKIAELRNERINTAIRLYKTENQIYHCVVRDTNKIMAIETKMLPIDIKNIKIEKDNPRNTINFTDGLNKYRFNISKSVLMKQFLIDKPLFELDIDILEDPFLELEKLTSKELAKKKSADFVVLPLYSIKNDEKYVPEKSGLNQWNAGGRKRENNEVYIPVPSIVHKKKPNFFPPREKAFHLVLTDNSVISAKICQQNNKALMSNPNSDLGKFILRDFFGFKKFKKITYQMLLEKGIDAVLIEKKGNKYYLDFLSLDSFELFLNDEPLNNV